ncbi:LAGLIDADG family homing endonuclease [Candidatus Peregrinibacteria bacterium]|nr:LAGLIDADG family homing endonuclease [Candidatus Peregrinibacteria bacterium]
MPRVKLQKISPQEFFEIIKTRGRFSCTGLAKLLNVHRRNLSTWRYGKTLMPLRVFVKIANLINFHPKFSVLPDYWHTKTAGRKGALMRIKRYGNPGTPEGRAKGGKITYQNFFRHPILAKKSGFITEKYIKIPVHSRNLAELIGIILGDGTISHYQTSISLNRYTDAQYGKYVVSLIKRILCISPSIYERDSVLYIVISSVKFIRFLLRQGFAIGSKIRQQIDIPQWIKESDFLTKACLRGLFDTDGCFYTDRHVYKSKKYLNGAINFTNRSLPILNFFKNTLEAFTFHPTQKTKFSVFLRREDEIKRFFHIIGSSNSKHLEKFNSYLMQKYGEVPKWS